MMARRPRRSSAIILLVAALCGSILLVPAIGGPIDRIIDPVRFAVHHRSASQTTVVVEMDAASVAAIRSWPWPRRHYAQVIDALHHAGAATIVFDVDFSSRSTVVDDRLMADALARAGGSVVLPTFAQRAGENDGRSLDALPIPEFRPNVTLASVSMAPDVDGIVRSMPMATITAGVPRPTLSAYVASRSGQADQTFPIDLSIDPATIPRLSFASVMQGHFDPAAVLGKNIVIGTTAIEMGDRYAVPLWGVLPGVIIQALAAETLIVGVPQQGNAVIPLLAALLLGVVILWRRHTLGLILSTAGAIVAFHVAALAAQYALWIDYPIASGLGTICLVVAGCVTRDIVRRFRMQSQTDETTLLPNRSAFTRRSFAQPVDVAVVKIDNLDAIAAVLGPQELANALIRTAERLKLASVDHQVYRVRGHHLAYVVAADQQLDDAMAGLRAILRQPVEVNGRRIDVLTSVGVAHGTDPATLLTDAALAAEQAQAANTFWRQSVANHGKLERSLSLMSDLEDAMAAGHIEVFYQPKLSLSTNRVTSVEALVRWRDPERGFIGPDQFIPMAEQTGRIQALTLHILAIVLNDASYWRSLGYPMTAGINISATLLTSKAFNDEVEALLAQSSVPAGDLIFEVTESAAMDDQEAAIVALRRYRDLGVAVSMDDYGTGQSTLSYIQLLPLSELKIDRSFVQFAHQNASDAILVQSTIDLAHRLGIKVVAEGIEDEACLEFLRANHCDLAQGYHISRPVPVADLLRFVGDARGMAA